MSDPTDAVTTAFKGLTTENNRWNRRSKPEKLPNEHHTRSPTDMRTLTFEKELQTLWSCGYRDVVPPAIWPKLENGKEKPLAEWPRRMSKGIMMIARRTQDITWTRNKLIEVVQARGQPHMAFLVPRDISAVVQLVIDSAADGSLQSAKPTKRAASGSFSSASKPTKRKASNSSPDLPTKRTKTVEDPEDSTMGK